MARTRTGTRRAGGEEQAPGTRPVLVTGMHRSGTSLVARLLNRCGLYLGQPDDMVPPASDNPEGFWEHARLVDVDDDILQLFGAAWDHPHLPDALAGDPRLGAAVATLTTEARELAASGQRWGFKDPRLCLTLPVWIGQFPEAGIVAVVRNPLEVATSLSERNGSSPSFGLHLWCRYYEALLAAAPPGQTVITHFDAYFAEPVEELARVTAAIGLSADTAALEAAVGSRHKQHRHSRFGWQDLAATGTGKRVRATYERLCEGAGWWDDAVQSKASRQRGPVTAGEPGDRPDDPLDSGTPGEDAAAAVNSHELDLRLLRYRYHRRGGQIAILERRIGDLERQAGGRMELRSGDAGAAPDLGQLHRRLDVLEEELGAVRQSMDTGRGEPGYNVGRIARLVARHGRLVLVAAPWTLPPERFGRALLPLPLPDWQPVDDAAAVWQLEALRASGASALLRPPDLSGDETLLEHLQLMYPEGESVTGFRVFDLTRRTASHALIDAVHDIEACVGTIPSLLDCTKEGVQDPLPRHPVVVAEVGGDQYADRSVDVVVVDDLDSVSLDHARRIATRAVLRRATSGVGIEWIDPLPALRTACVVVALPRHAAVAAERVDALLAALPEQAAPTILVAGAPPGWSPPSARVRAVDATDDLPSLLAAGASSAADVVVAISSGAVPVGQWLGPVLRLFEDAGVDAVCGRWVAPDGTLLSAGGDRDPAGAPRRTGAGDIADSPRYRHVRKADWAPGPAVAVRRQCVGSGGPAATGPGLTLSQGGVAYQPEWLVVQLPES